DLLGAHAVDRADEGQEQNAVVDADDRRRELTEGGLVTLKRLDVRGDVRVDGEGDVEEDDLLDTPVRRGRLRRRERSRELLAQQVEVLPVGREVPLGREADALVHGADAEAVLDVREVAPTVEEAAEVVALGALHAADGRL